MQRKQKKIIIKPLYENCPFCEEKKVPDYKDPEVLHKFLSERSRILSRERSGVCARHQRMLSREVKRARFLALLPYVEKIK